MGKGACVRILHASLLSLAMRAASPCQQASSFSAVQHRKRGTRSNTRRPCHRAQTFCHPSPHRRSRRSQGARPCLPARARTFCRDVSVSLCLAPKTRKQKIEKNCNFSATVSPIRAYPVRRVGEEERRKKWTSTTLGTPRSAQAFDSQSTYVACLLSLPARDSAEACNRHTVRNAPPHEPAPRTDCAMLP